MRHAVPRLAPARPLSFVAATATLLVGAAAAESTPGRAGTGTTSGVASGATSAITTVFRAAGPAGAHDRRVATGVAVNRETWDTAFETTASATMSGSSADSWSSIAPATPSRRAQP